ncbi:MAG: hypothetical protein LAT63_10725 [Marinobacter sp.]|nr:hypothetical protein [Marinobacter sp.]
MASACQTTENRQIAKSDAAQQLLEQIERAFSPQEWMQIQRTVSPIAQQ